MIAAQLTPNERQAARRVRLHHNRSQTPLSDLLQERRERVNLAARYAANLEAGDVSEGDPDQLRGGMAYEAHHIQEIDREVERRDRAAAYGYVEGDRAAEQDLHDRFAAARSLDCAETMRALSGQPGQRSGDRTLFFCPFHNDCNTPSLTTYPGDRGWHCFTCKAGGADAASLVAEFNGIGMAEALRLLESGALGVGGGLS